VRRAGDDVTIVATGAMVGRALAAADALAASGVAAEVIDPRTLVPLDMATILDSVRKTGRLILVDQATRHASASAVIAAEVADRGFGYLKAPVKLVADAERVRQAELRHHHQRHELGSGAALLHRGGGRGQHHVRDRLPVPDHRGRGPVP